MSDFYSELADMARELLAPTSQNGLGQGTIMLTHVTPGTPDPAEPWKPVQPQTTTQTLRGAVRGVSKELIGTEAGGTIILASDRQAITEVPTLGYEPGDLFGVDGQEVFVIRVDNIPAAGVTSAVRWVIR